MDRTIDTDKQSIEDLLRNYGWTGGDHGEFYFDGYEGNTYPHLHLKVNNRYKKINSIGDILPYVDFMALTFGFGEGRKNIEILNGSEPIDRAKLETHLDYYVVDNARANRIKKMINRIAKMGLITSE